MKFYWGFLAKLLHWFDYRVMYRIFNRRALFVFNLFDKARAKAQVKR